MVFSSIIFLFLFLPLTLLGYLIAGKRLRNLLLLCASLVFYAWGETYYVALMLVSIAVNYMAGLAIDRFRNASPSRLFLAAAIAFNIGLLALFKYTNFAFENLNFFADYLGVTPIEIDSIHLPIGISFFTFQAMSYVIDVYRNDARVQRNPINIGLYIALFPQLIAGPIVRYHHIAHQINQRRTQFADISRGVERFIIGLGKKVLIANQVAIVSDLVFGQQTSQLTPALAWLGVLCYTLQIYFDFSGYSDMAIGLGRMFGFRFLENFNYPYISRSIREFWRRWHISLSSWFRDYLYIPLGGNREGPWRTYVNLLLVFFLCGLWHGASWNFVIWGLLHGVFLVFERLGFEKLLKRLPLVFRHGYVLLVVVVGWVFFRAETLSGALQYLQVMFGFSTSHFTAPVAIVTVDIDVRLAIAAGVVFSIPVVHTVQWFNTKLANSAVRFPEGITSGFTYFAKTAVIVLILYLSVLSLASGAYNPFIYFRF